MCEVCKIEGVDSLFKNGSKNILSINNLFKVFKNAVVPIKLCYVHSVELFQLGERRFLYEHLDFTLGILARHQVSSDPSDANFFDP